MTLIEWFKINPRHKVELTDDGDGIQAVLYNGEGIDRHIVGRGADETQAIAHALEVRADIVERLSV